MGIVAAGEWSDGDKLFALGVQPVLARKCFACHGRDEKKIEGEIGSHHASRDAPRGERGDEVLVPGKAKASSLYVAVTREVEDLQMPPKENDKLTQAEQWAVRDWINAGAPWPGDEVIAKIREQSGTGRTVATSGG